MGKYSACLCSRTVAPFLAEEIHCCVAIKTRFFDALTLVFLVVIAITKHRRFLVRIWTWHWTASDGTRRAIAMARNVVQR